MNLCGKILPQKTEGGKEVMNMWVMNMEKKAEKKKAKKQETWVSDPTMDPTYEGIVYFEYGKLLHGDGCFRKRKLPTSE